MSATEVDSVSLVKIPKPPILPLLGRTVSLFVALILAVAIACTWWTRGYQWVYDPKSGEWPLAKCPPIQDASQHRGVGPDGPRCQVGDSAATSLEGPPY